MGPFWSEFIPPESHPKFRQNRAILPEYFLANIIIHSDQNVWLPFDFWLAEFFLPSPNVTNKCVPDFNLVLMTPIKLN